MKSLTLSMCRIALSFMALLALLPAADAQTVIVNNLDDTITGSTANVTNPYKSEGFSTMVNGDISSVVLNLVFTATGSPLPVYLYTATGTGSPTALVGTLGTITANPSYLNTTFAYNLSVSPGFTLSAGQDYAIAIELNGVVKWDYAAFGSPNSGTGGSFLGAFSSPDGSSSWSQTGGQGSQQRMMEVQVTPAPEPTTGALLGFGILALGIRLRHNRNDQVFSIKVNS